VQTLYWAIFGLVEKDRMDSLHRKHTFTMFIGLLMFGVYSAIMVVLVNMLIAMMSNSYQKIAVSLIRKNYFKYIIGFKGFILKTFLRIKPTKNGK
jgi:hypothetical protein